MTHLWKLPQKSKFPYVLKTPLHKICFCDANNFFNASWCRKFQILILQLFRNFLFQEEFFWKKTLLGKIRPFLMIYCLVGLSNQPTLHNAPILGSTTGCWHLVDLNFRFLYGEKWDSNNIQVGLFQRFPVLSLLGLCLVPVYNTWNLEQWLARGNIEWKSGMSFYVQ